MARTDDGLLRPRLAQLLESNPAATVNQLEKQVRESGIRGSTTRIAALVRELRERSAPLPTAISVVAGVSLDALPAELKERLEGARTLLEQVLGDAIDQVAVAAQAKVQEALDAHASERARLEAELTEWEAEVDSVRVEAERARGDMRLLEMTVEMARAEANRLKAEGDTIRSDLQHVNGTVETLREQIVAARDEAQRTGLERDHARHRLESAQADIDRLSAQVADLKSARDGAQIEAEKARSELIAHLTKSATKS